LPSRPCSTSCLWGPRYDNERVVERAVSSGRSQDCFYPESPPPLPTPDPPPSLARGRWCSRGGRRRRRRRTAARPAGSRAKPPTPSKPPSHINRWRRIGHARPPPTHHTNPGDRGFAVGGKDRESGIWCRGAGGQADVYSEANFSGGMRAIGAAVGEATTRKGVGNESKRWGRSGSRWGSQPPPIQIPICPGFQFRAPPRRNPREARTPPPRKAERGGRPRASP